MISGVACRRSALGVVYACVVISFHLMPQIVGATSGYVYACVYFTVLLQFHATFVV